VCRITRCTRSQEWFGKIAVHKRNARRHAATQRISTGNDQRFARDLGRNQAQRHR
jgi:hypothetical protein